jgi:hypothetical protein
MFIGAPPVKGQEHVRAYDALEGKFSLVEVMRRRFAPFGGGDLELPP